ncbi:hypothetical protein Stsp02_06890 [Streptomyces sp. NBRC 14336]|nr:hypothetical protein Stsp02_06890 [Streptomyces sp. NBRC 14336]
MTRVAFRRLDKGCGTDSNGAANGPSRLRMRTRLGARGGARHTDRMLTQTTFLFTYGIRPAGCHGRAA